MDYIERYFKDKTKDISFIEVKDGSQVAIGDYEIEQGIPLPIITSDLIEEIQSGNLQEEIKVLGIIEGIIYLLGTDREFPYGDEYKRILMSYRGDIGNYILYHGIKDMEKGDYDRGGIKFRTLLSIEPDNVIGLFNYAIVLEEIGNRFMKNGEEDRSEEFIESSTSILESILDIDEEFSLAYYKLGFHYSYKGKYLKANLIWKKFLLLSDDELLLQEIREEMERIHEDVLIEVVMTYLANNDFDRALDNILKLMPKYEDNWNINYLIGYIYGNLGQYKLAIDYLDRAIELNLGEPDSYIELGSIYFNIGQITEAIDIFSRGIEYCAEDYRLYFNRGLCYAYLGRYEEGYIDIDRASILNPQDEIVIEQKLKLESMEGKI